MLGDTVATYEEPTEILTDWLLVGAVAKRTVKVVVLPSSIVNTLLLYYFY